MSVQKSFRLDEFAHAILEILAEREGKTQTAIIEELIKGHVIFDLDPEESSKIMKAAAERIHNIKSVGENQLKHD